MLILNKMFRREKILETGIRMPILTHASDAGFFFSFLYSCEKIVGCPHEFLIYKKRIFLEDSSLSQDSNIDSVNSYYQSYKIILNAFNSYCNKYKDKLEANNDYNGIYEFERYSVEYIDTLIYKEITALFINITYRFFWRSDIETLKHCKYIINKLKDDLFPSTWTKLIENNKDLQLDNIIVNHSEMAINPIISVILNDLYTNINSEYILDLDSLNRIISNCYNSHFPSFELIISENLFNNLNEELADKPNIKFINSKSNQEFKNKAINIANGEFLFFIEEDILFSPALFKKMFDKINDYDWILAPMDSVIDSKFSTKDTYTINSFSKRKIIDSNFKYDNLLSDKLFKKQFLRNIDFEFSNNINEDIKILYNEGNYKKFNMHNILTTNSFLDNPYISVIIDNASIEQNDLNNLLDSLYNQTFKAFDIFINQKLKTKVSKNHSSMNNIHFLKDVNFKQTAIKESKSKYTIFIDIPIIYDSKFLEKAFLKIDKSNNIMKEDFSFLSTPIYPSKNKKAYNFSSQKLAYFYKNSQYPSNKSKFLVFDLYLSNKLINLDYLRKNNIYFNNCNIDVLNIYKHSNSVRINEKLVFTDLNQKKLFKSSFNHGKIPLSIKIFYNFHKLFLILLYIKKVLNNSRGDI